MGNPVIQVRIPAEDLERAQQAAKEQGLPVSAWVRDLIYAELIRIAAAPLVEVSEPKAAPKKKPKSAPTARAKTDVVPTPTASPVANPAPEPTPEHQTVSPDSEPSEVPPGRCKWCGGKLHPRTRRCFLCNQLG